MCRKKVLPEICLWPRTILNREISNFLAWKRKLHHIPEKTWIGHPYCPPRILGYCRAAHVITYLEARNASRTSHGVPIVIIVIKTDRIAIYIYIYVFVCLITYLEARNTSRASYGVPIVIKTNRIAINIYIYVCVCVCVCVYIYMQYANAAMIKIGPT